MCFKTNKLPLFIYIHICVCMCGGYTKLININLRKGIEKTLPVFFFLNQKGSDGNHSPTSLFHDHGRNLLASLRRTKLPWLRRFL